MSSSNLAWLRLGAAISLCVLALTACQYDVPITSTPTRNVEQRLVGNWNSLDGKERMNVRRLDDTTYIVYYDGDLFRAYHSDLGTTPFVTVQDLNLNDRKYATDHPDRSEAALKHPVKIHF